MLAGVPMLPRGRRHHSWIPVSDPRFPGGARCSWRVASLLVSLILMSVSVRFVEATQGGSPPSNTDVSAEIVGSHINPLSNTDALTAQRSFDDKRLYCPALSLSFYLGAAMGVWSQHDRLVRCVSDRFSSILDDVRLSREDRESHRRPLSELWRRARGIREKYVFYDNFEDFMALKTEIRRVVRVRHTIGMHPQEYSSVLSSVADILDLNLTADLLPPNSEGPRPIIANEEEVKSLDEACDTDPVCLQRRVLNEYRRYANRTLEALPHLIVSEATLRRAMAYYRKNVPASIVVRSYNLNSAHSNSFDRDVADFLRAVQYMWDTATQEVVRESDDASAQDDMVSFSGTNRSESRNLMQAPRSPSKPFLPFIKVSDFTGPPMLDRARVFLLFDHPEPPSRGSGGARQQALPRILPTAIVYHTTPNCASCAAYDRAFDLLPGLFKTLCSRPHVSMVGCSPVTFFMRTTNTRVFDLVPSLDIYARLRYTREAVLRTADTNGHFFGGGSTDGGDDDDDDGTDVARFYSLNSQYRSHRTDLERELLPRNQFTPIRVPLRQVSDAATVEDALTSMFSELVGHGVVQFAFMGKSQLSRILKKNQELQERVERRRRGEEGGEGNSSNAAATSPAPSSSMEMHPEYRKVVTFHDLATELVSSYTRTYFGDVSRTLSRHGWYRRSASSTGRAWWMLSLLVDTVIGLWNCIRSELETPLIPAFFLVLCTAQLTWNRAQRVSYW